MTPVIERDQKPLYVVRWSGDPTAEDVRRHLQQVTDILSIHRSAFVHDMRELGVPPAALRREAAAALEAHFETFRDMVAGAAHVVSNSLVSGAMTALYWLAPPPFPTLNTTDYDAGLRWAREQLQGPHP